MDIEQIAQQLYGIGIRRGGPGSREQDEALDIEANDLLESLSAALDDIRRSAYAAGMERGAEAVKAEANALPGDAHPQYYHGFKAGIRTALAAIRAAAAAGEG
jgi:hypothetical protein